MKSQKSISIIQPNYINQKKKQIRENHQDFKDKFRKYKNTLQTKQDLAKQGENYYNFLLEEKKLQRKSISQHDLQVIDQNTSKGVNRRRRYIQTLDPNQIPASTSAKNDKLIELEAQKIQKLKQKMNLINNEIQQAPDVITSLSIKPISKLELYSPYKQCKSTSQYLKSDSNINSPIDSYLLKKLEKIAEGKKEKSPEPRQGRKLLPLSSMNRNKNSFFIDQANNIDYKSEICRETGIQQMKFEAIKQQSRQQLNKVFNQLSMSGTNRNYNLASLE